MIERYESLSGYHSACDAALLARDRAHARLTRRWNVLKDPHTRGSLLKDAVGDVLRSWTPYKRVHDLLHGRVSGSTVAAVGMAVASAQRGMGKRLLYSGLSMVLGKVIGDPQQNGEGMLHSVASAVGRGVRFMRERKAARQEHADDVTSTPDDRR